MSGSIESLERSLSHYDGAGNDHDYICVCRPVDVRAVLQEVERLRAVGECNQKLMAQSGGRWGMRFIRLWPTDYVLRLGCMGSGKPIGIMQPTGSWLSANWRWWRIYRINRKRAAGGDGDGK